MKSICMLLLCLLTAVPSGAQDFMPLAPGNFWSYILDDGSHELRVVGGPVPLFGEMVFPIGHPGFDPFQNLVNYWTTGPDGDLLLHGWSRGNIGFLYQPPIPVLDVPLALGKTWSATVDVYAATDSSYVETFELGFSVFDQAEITVPAGTFGCYGTGQLAGPDKAPFGGRYNVLGEEIGSKVGEIERWYAADVGVVEEYLDQVYQLETFTDHQVSLKSSSWGGIKALFR